MTSYFVEDIADASEDIAGKIFPLTRADHLQANITRLFSRHFGNLRSGAHFEAECIIVTGASGSGKTKEVITQIKSFNAEKIALPTGHPAKMVSCLLDAKGSWKDLGSATLKALGYPLQNSSRYTQATINQKIVEHAKRTGVIGIHFDEAQHILRTKSDVNRLITLDSFKTFLKTHDWPLMLILTGIPELLGYIAEEPQLHRLATYQTFEDLELPQDFEVINEIVQSVAMQNGLKVSGDVATRDLYSRLAASGAFRWGLVIKLAVVAAEFATLRGAAELSRMDFTEAWFIKSKLRDGLNPFTHDAWEKMLRREHPFKLFPVN